MSIRRTSAAALLTVWIWTWAGAAHAGEIHKAVGKGDLERVKAMLKENRALVKDTTDFARRPCTLRRPKGMWRSPSC
jgi:hypothetical protein